jgi:mannose-6-phosphate isomerase-like protein (cupin superfamily)
MRCAAIVLAFVLLGTSSGLAQEIASSEHVVQVYQEARHHPVFENSLVRILDVRVPGGDTTDYHVHANRHIAVVIAGARSWDQGLGTAAPESASMALPVGAVLDNASASIPYTHRVGNADTVAFRYLVAQMLAPSGVPSSMLPPSSGLRFDHETMGARVYRATLAPGQSIARHRHSAPGLTIQVGAGKLRIDGTAAEGRGTESGAGAWWWRGAGAEHALRNTGAQAVDIVEIDWP